MVLHEKSFDPFSKKGENKFIYLSPILNKTIQIPASKRAHLLLPEELPETRDPVKKNTFSNQNNPFSNFEQVLNEKPSYLDHLRLEQTNHPRFSIKKEIKMITKDNPTLSNHSHAFSKDFFKKSEKRDFHQELYLNDLKKINSQIDKLKQSISSLQNELFHSTNQKDLLSQIEESQKSLNELESRQREITEKIKDKKRSLSPKNSPRYSPKSSPRNFGEKRGSFSSNNSDNNENSNENQNNKSVPEIISITFNNITKQFDSDTTKWLLKIIKKRKTTRPVISSQPNPTPHSPVLEGLYSRGANQNWNHKIFPHTSYSLFDTQHLQNNNLFLNQLCQNDHPSPSSTSTSSSSNEKKIFVEDYKNETMDESEDTANLTEPSSPNPSPIKPKGNSKPPSRTPPSVEPKNYKIPLEKISKKEQMMMLHDLPVTKSNQSNSSRTSTGSEDYSDDFSSKDESSQGNYNSLKTKKGAGSLKNKNKKSGSLKKNSKKKVSPRSKKKDPSSLRNDKSDEPPHSPPSSSPKKNKSSPVSSPHKEKVFPFFSNIFIHF